MDFSIKKTTRQPSLKLSKKQNKLEYFEAPKSTYQFKRKSSKGA